MLGRSAASPRKRTWLRWAVAAAAACYAGVFLFNVVKPLPEGTSMAGPPRDPSGLEFLYDLTFERAGETVTDQRIFDRIFSMIDAAEDFVVLDMFLFNGEQGGERDYRPLAEELTDHLVARKKTHPGLTAVFVTDEINNFYGAYTSPEISRLRAAGVRVVTTRMTRLRDSNPAYSAAWRMAVAWLGTGGPGWLPHPLSNTGRKVTARAYLKVFNFKANHRKLLVTERGCLVASANPHDASAFHSNVAFAGSGLICADLLESERAVAAFSGASVEEWPVYRGSEGETVGRGIVRLVTEGKIRESLLRDVRATGPGDRVDMAMFYVADREVVHALLDADRRGVAVRLILDPNKDAFGRQKGGIPNRQVAGELVSRSEGRIGVRWYDTHGEQFHTKLVLVTRGDWVTIFGGSANLTRRNLADYNLETDLRVQVPRESALAEGAADYFETIFANREAAFTLPFEAYRDDSWIKRVVYRVQEFSGLSSF